MPNSIRVLRKIPSKLCMMPFSIASSTGTQVNEKFYKPFLLTASALAAASSLVPSFVPATTSSVILPSGVYLSLFLVFPTQLNYCGTHYELLISVSINFNQFPKLSHSHACWKSAYYVFKMQNIYTRRVSWFFSSSLDVCPCSINFWRDSSAHRNGGNDLRGQIWSLANP